MEVSPIFFFRSLSLHFSKPEISSYLRVFVIESPFLIDWKGLGWICLLAGIVTLTFGARSIDYFHDTNTGELTCSKLSRVCSLFPPIFEAYSRNICDRLVGDLASLSLLSSMKVTSMPQRTEACFCSEMAKVRRERTSEPVGRV